jgi:hypothetical protein
VADGWLRCYRIAQRDSFIEAKRAEGGEPYGDEVMRKTAKPGEWLCRNPENGYTWVVSDEGFEELYCEVGKSRPVKEKKQEDGYRKGQSRRRSASHEGLAKDHGGPLFSSWQEDVEDDEASG